MRLTSLELLGFKSFLHRTTFQFNEGVTCIVGPNGCGKSNIVDAITWVLGERGTKSLRVKEMGDVIFHGSDSKKQVNMAEVTMGLVKDETEYAIKRRIYRDGTNEYYLNGNSVRLKDIQDFLLGTGIGLHSYAIIEQGNIEYFTQMKPHERRLVVEETSGITRFEEKKRDAFVRFEEVRSSLERVEDIEREVTISHKKAVEEAERLKIYNGFRERLRDIDIAILVDGHRRLAKKEAKLQERELIFLKEMESKDEYRANLNERIAAKENEIGLMDGASRKNELDIKEKEKDLERLLLEITHLDAEKKRLQGEESGLAREITVLSERIVAHSQEIDALRESTGQALGTLEKMEAAVADLEARRNELRRVRERLEKEAEMDRNNLFGVMTRLTEIRNGVTERERALKEREARRQRRLEEERLLRERLSVLEQTASTLKLRLDAEKSDKDLLISEEAEQTQRIETMNSEILKLRSALEGLKGVRKGKEDVLRQMKSPGAGKEQEAASFTRLISIVSVSKEMETVLERFFSHEMEYRVLIEQDPANLAALVRDHGGDAVFFPPKGIFAIRGEGAEPLLTHVEDLSEVFQRIADGEEGIFLTDGIMIDSRGFVRKGRDKNALSIGEFRRKTKIESELTELSGQIAAKASRVDELLAALRELEKGRQVFRDNRKAKDAITSRLEREFIEATTQAKTLKERMTEAVVRTDSDEHAEDSWSEEQVAADKLNCEKEKVLIEQRLADRKAMLEEAKEEYTSLDAEYHEISITFERQKNEVKKSEEETSRKRAAIETFQKEKLEKEKKRFQAGADLEKAVTKASALEQDHSVLQEACKASVARYEDLARQLGTLHMERTSLQDESKALDLEMEKTRARTEAAGRERLVLVEKRDAIADRLRSDYSVKDMDQVSIEVVPDEAERDRALAEISALGEVNFRAEKERIELKERIDFLAGQKGDLLQAIESLKKTIAKIDSVSRELFLETFDRVNDAFQRFTRTLFKGGHGHLVLNQETSGIELFVQPPGKKVIRMELLSGGEKALISLAFLLSLMDTKASPFTLMDEIDAPLDDANLVSLLDIVKLISGKTQVVLITHNRITMEASGSIYGITMEEAGISKTISIKL